MIVFEPEPEHLVWLVSSIKSLRAAVSALICRDQLPKPYDASRTLVRMIRSLICEVESLTGAGEVGNQIRTL